MSFVAGTRLGPYEVLGSLGAGGMGEVYRARDTRLDRTVAIKVLPASLAADPTFRDRFEREARSLSALSHPHICTVHDIGREGDIDYLVMEYLEGRTLAAVLEQGPMPGAEALRLAVQIADALGQAHRHGIIHRDLKPGNVMIRHTRGAPTTGTATLLDFGLAKQTTAAVAASDTHVQADATRAAPLTSVGTILGTFQYMAPEQIDGRETDVRTDIWAFGCLLYEMLTGRRAFEAPTQASAIAAILERQPAPIDLPDAALAPGLNRLIAACLEKDPDERFQSMRDVRRALEWIQQTVPVPTGHPRRRVSLPAAALLAIVVLGATALVVFQRPATADLPPSTVFTVGLDTPGYSVGQAGIFGGAGSGTPSVAPDGNRIAFIARSASEAAIWVRDLSKLEAEELRGTRGARGLFWSPDGGSIGFFAGGKLKTIAVATGEVSIVGDAPVPFGGTWSSDGTILFSPDERSPLYRVSARGGTPAAVTSLTPGQEDAHRWPHFLPDGRHYLYMPWADGTTTRHITLGSLDGAPPRTLFESQSGAVLAGDQILYVRDQPARLMAWPFDLRTMQLRGTTYPLVPDDNVDYQWFTGEPNASAGGGTLAYTTGKYRRTQLTWVNRTGRALETLGEITVQFDPVVSANGAMLALERHDGERGSGDIWIGELTRGTFSRLTSMPGFETTPIWSPDGQRVAYASDEGSAPAIYVSQASGAGGRDLLVSPGARSFPLDWSPDGRHVVFMLNGGATRNDLWSYDLQERRAAPLLASPFNEGWARISPDGRWIAYVSDETRQLEVYVRSFPDGAVKTQISTAGGTQPQWRRDGKELFYIAPDNTITAVDVRSAADRLEASKPVGLFAANVDQNKSIRNQYAASPDGQRFLVLSLAERDASPIVAVVNWRRLVRQ